MANGLNVLANNKDYHMKKLFLIALSSLPMLTYAVDWSISPTSKNIGTGGGSFSITISNPTDNALEYAAGADVDWITIAPRNYYATTVNASVDANGNLIYSRSGYVTVSAYLHGQTHNYVNSKGYRRCYVTQSGQGASFSPSNVSFAGTNSAATITVNVKTGISWELESSADWLSLDDTSGTGSKVVKVLASINETGIARSATIKIYDEGVGCSAPYSLTVTQAPLPPSHFITYENTMGADNPNPATYIEGESFTFDPLDAIVGYSFTGWIPDCINETNTQDMIVSATWAPVSYQVAYEPNGGMGQMNATSVVYDVEFLISDNEFTWENHEFLGWALAHDAGVSYNAGDVVSNLTSTANDIVTLYAVWKELLVAPVITPNDGHVFYGNSCEVTISCPTEGAVIYYTTNGNTPKTTSANLYGGPFIIDETTTVRAVAVKDDKKQYSVAVITKSSVALTLETALGNADGIVITTGGPAEWNAIVDDTATSGLSVQSGEIQDSNESWLQATVRGEGTISFLSKTSCEHDEENTFTWDCLKVFVDGNERPDWRMDGESDWTIRTITFESADTHTVRWVYHKDDSEKEGDDCAWVSGFTWTPSGTAEPFPDVATNAAPETVAAAFSGAADAGLAANVTDGTNYNAFCEWAARVKGASGSAAVGAQTVKESAKAWLSYALGADRLITKEITSNDVHIAKFEISSATDGGAMGASCSIFAFEVAIDGVEIGSGSVAEAVLKENLKKVLGIEGTASLTPAVFSSDNIDITFDTPVDGKAKFTVAPPADAGNSFFMRVKVK